NTSFSSSHAPRLRKEKELLAQLKLQRIDHPSEVLYVSTVSCYSKLFGHMIEHAVYVFRNISDLFKHTPISVKVSYIENFLVKFSDLKCSYSS
ncbi:hypothetical protein PFISCL1PPCAC_13847, partial [Pristionchus fissidentatus]